MHIPDRVRYACQEIDSMISNDHSRSRWLDMEYQRLSTAMTLLGDFQPSGGPEMSISLSAASNSVRTLREIFDSAYREDRISEDSFKHYTAELAEIGKYLDGLVNGTKRFKK